jgi:hypothetical protein
LTLEHRAVQGQIRARNCYAKRDLPGGLLVLLEEIRALGIELKSHYTEEEAANLFSDARQVSKI